VALSVRLDPVLEARVDEESKRLGISKSELVKDALELRLAMKNPYDLLRQVRSGTPAGHVDRSEQTGIGLKVKLRAKRAD
jgi:predicted DNA-binding protein